MGGIEQSTSPDSRRRVRLLDPHTINQIAAGEVVERPASVVKELVENALDAGSTRVEVELRQSGRTLIRISDNGIGMLEEDALAALQRHATSKIVSTDDLLDVGTLGFRGEALPSIASVSRMTLSTGIDDGLRTVIRIDGGQIQPISRAAGPRGTEIIVEDLFFNTPARLKFLKSDTTELGQIMEHVSRYAVAYPHVAFTLIHNGQDALSTTGSSDMLEAISDVWGRDMARALAPLDLDAAGLKIGGFVSPPHITKPTRAYQYIYVNGRPVRTRTLTAAIDQSFRDITPDRRFPLLILTIDVDPATIDVNVSPTKSEIKFQREGAAFEAIRAAVKQALLDYGMMPDATKVAAANEALRAAQLASSGASLLDDFRLQAPPSQFTITDFRLPESATLPPRFAGPEFDPADPFSRPSGDAMPSGPLLPPSPYVSNTAAALPFIQLLDGLRIIGQAMNTFIIAETTHGLVVIDQHVAHERILYEYLCGIKGQTAIEKQALLVPQTLHLDRRSAVLLREKVVEIQAVGFDLEPFGGESYVVRAVPAAIRNKDPLKILRDLVDELVETSVTRKLVPTREQIWITSSCHMAVKAGDPLSMAEMEKLIVDLAETENPYLCPHGRPITVTLSRDSIMRLFKRT